MKKYTALFTVLAVAVMSMPLFLPTRAVSPNAAPIPKEQEYNTYTDVEIFGTASAVDPEGDIVTFAVAKKPHQGTVMMEPNGRFTYTPDKGKNGRDTFTYIAADNHGNVSAEAVVTVYIRKLSSDVCYSDMVGSDAHYAAVCLAEKGIFVGKCVDGEYFFEPQETVSRGDFLVMCMRICGIDKLTSVSRTGFSDDESISCFLKPYVAAGLMNGIIRGYTAGDSVVFSPDKAITLAEAAVTLDNSMALTDVYAGSVNNTCPAWARQASVNLETNHIVSADSAYNEPLTRAEAAKMLVASMEVLSKR